MKVTWCAAGSSWNTKPCFSPGIKPDQQHQLFVDPYCCFSEAKDVAEANQTRPFMPLLPQIQRSSKHKTEKTCVSKSKRISARMWHRPTEAEISFRVCAKQTAQLLGMYPLPLSFLIDSPTRWPRPVFTSVHHLPWGVKWGPHVSRALWPYLGCIKRVKLTTCVLSPLKILMHFSSLLRI